VVVLPVNDQGAELSGPGTCGGRETLAGIKNTDQQGRENQGKNVRVGLQR
jgi:hypothetical protein